MSENKKPVGPSNTSTTGSRPSMPKKGEEEDLMGQPKGPSPAPNPESAPGGDKVGE